MTTPDVGPPFTPEDAKVANWLLLFGGPKLVYTLALGLQAVLPELASEPERFLTEAEALRLASALMSCLPAGWDQEEPMTDPDPTKPLDEDQRRAAIRAKLEAASTPTAVFREVKNG